MGGRHKGRKKEERERKKIETRKAVGKKKKVARRKAKIKRKRQSIGRAGQQQGTAPMPRPRPGTVVGSSAWEPFLAHGGALWQHRVPKLPLSSTQSCPEQELPYLQYALAICPSVRNAVLAPRSRSEEETGQGHTLPVAAQPVAAGTQPPAARAGAGCRLPAGCSQPLPLPDTDRSGSLTWGPPLLGDSQLLMENKSPITSWSPPPPIRPVPPMPPKWPSAGPVTEVSRGHSHHAVLCLALFFSREHGPCPHKQRQQQQPAQQQQEQQQQKQGETQ